MQTGTHKLTCRSHPSQKPRRTLLREYSDVPGEIKSLQLAIKLQDDILVQKQCNSIPRSLYGEVKEYLLDLIRRGWIVTSTSLTLHPLGFYQWKRIPFGLTGDPGAFQCCMDSILEEIKDELCLPYLDDVIVYSRTFEQHLEHLGTGFQRLRSAGAKLKGAKCDILRQEVRYLGHIVSE